MDSMIFTTAISKEAKIMNNPTPPHTISMKPGLIEQMAFF